MPGIDASIPLGIKQPDQMQNLSSLLGVANGMQTLQQNQQKTQQGGMDLQERQGMQQFLSDPSNFTDAQGNLDPMKMQAGASRFAPTTGFKYMQAAAEAHKAHTEATKALNSLTADNRLQIGSVLSSLPPDAAPDLVHKTVDALNDQYKGRLSPLVSIFKGGYDNAVKTGGAQGASAFVQQQAQSVLPQTTQQEMNTPNGPMLTNGQQSVQVNTRPGVRGIAQGAPVPGTAVQQLIPVGQQDGVTNDSQGNMHVVHKDAFGNVIGTRPLQAAAPATAGAPAAPGPFTMPPGETAETLKGVQAIRQNANQAATTVKDQQFNANQIIKLADETSTGKGSQIVASLKGGYAGVPWTSDAASNYNQLGHYMALQTSQLAQSSGLGGTDAAHGIAAEQAGNKEWTADAIKSTARVNRALSTGTDLFNRGVESAINRSNSPFAAREFQNAWSKTADVDALRLYDSMKNKSDDPEGFKKTLHELGGTDSDKYKRTLAKVTEMRKLIKGE